MSTSPDSVPLKYRSSSDYLASLPPWRRLLAKLNWHPVREIEIETWRVRIEKEQLKRESEQIRKETEQLRKESALLKKEDERRRNEDERRRNANERLRQIDAQIEALFCSEGSCSSPAKISDDASTPF